MEPKGPAGRLAVEKDPKVPSGICLPSVAPVLSECFSVLSHLIPVTTHSAGRGDEKTGFTG